MSRFLDITSGNTGDAFVDASDISGFEELTLFHPMAGKHSEFRFFSRREGTSAQIYKSVLPVTSDDIRDRLSDAGIPLIAIPKVAVDGKAEEGMLYLNPSAITYLVASDLLLHDETESSMMLTFGFEGGGQNTYRVPREFVSEIMEKNKLCGGTLQPVPAEGLTLSSRKVRFFAAAPAHIVALSDEDNKAILTFSQNDRIDLHGNNAGRFDMISYAEKLWNRVRKKNIDVELGEIFRRAAQQETRMKARSRLDFERAVLTLMPAGYSPAGAVNRLCIDALKVTSVARHGNALLFNLKKPSGHTSGGLVSATFTTTEKANRALKKFAL